MAQKIKKVLEKSEAQVKGIQDLELLLEEEDLVEKELFQDENGTLYIKEDEELIKINFEENIEVEVLDNTEDFGNLERVSGETRGLME